VRGRRWIASSVIRASARANGRGTSSIFVAQVRRDDEDLGTELASLLLGHEQRTLTLDQPVGTREVLEDPSGKSILGRFRITRLLGRSGMGEVHEATDLELGHVVDLKTTRSEIAGDARAISRGAPCAPDRVSLCYKGLLARGRG
jgi:hypothetical protein